MRMWITSIKQSEGKWSGAWLPIPAAPSTWDRDVELLHPHRDWENPQFHNPIEQMEEAPDPQDVGRGWQEQCPNGNSWPLQNDTFICPLLSICTRLRARRRRIIYPLTYRLCLVYKQWLYKLLRKLSMKNNNNSPCSPPVVSTFGPLENPLGPQILPGKGWEGAKEMPGEGGPGTHHYPSSPAQLLPELDFIHIYIYISLTYVFLYTYNHKYILYI